MLFKILIFDTGSVCNWERLSRLIFRFAVIFSEYSASAKYFSSSRFFKKQSPAEFCKKEVISKNSFFRRTPMVAASVLLKLLCHFQPDFRVVEQFYTIIHLFSVSALVFISLIFPKFDWILLIMSTKIVTHK